MSDREQLYLALLRGAADAARAIDEGCCTEAAVHLDRAMDLAEQAGHSSLPADEDGIPPLAPLCAHLLTARAALLRRNVDAARAALAAFSAPPGPSA